MNYQFIDITSYRGISSDAEHWYAKIGVNDYTQEDLLFTAAAKVNCGVLYVNGEELRYYPTEEEATAMYRKDNWEKKTLDEFDMERIRDVTLNGTIRFPSILAVVKAAKKMFPDAMICFSICGSQSEFAKYMGGHKAVAEQVIKVMLKD